jgi:hypothetical protein
MTREQLEMLRDMADPTQRDLQLHHVATPWRLDAIRAVLEVVEAAQVVEQKDHPALFYHRELRDAIAALREKLPGKEQ